MRTLLVRPEAEQDLSEIEQYSFENHGARRADAYLDDIYKALQFLRDNPEVGPVHIFLRPAIRTWSVSKHKVFYDFDGTHLTVARILHQAMDPAEHL